MGNEASSGSHRTYRTNRAHRTYAHMHILYQCGDVAVPNEGTAGTSFDGFLEKGATITHSGGLGGGPALSLSGIDNVLTLAVDIDPG